MIKVTKRKVLAVKKKLMPLLSLKDKYSTTYKDIKKFFTILNEGLFDNKSRKNVDCKNRSYFIVATYDDKKVI